MHDKLIEHLSKARLMPLDCTFNGGENRPMGKAAASSPAGDLRERRFSGRLSDDYDLWHLARPFLGEVHEIVVRAVRSFTEARDRPLRALDIGMGDGAITRLLVADAQLSVTGVDNEPKMIKKARERLTAQLASGRLKIVLDDALHFLTNQPSHAFDIIASGYVLHNLTADYRARLYDEIWRMLAPSGLFVNADKYAQTGEAHREALRWQLNWFFDVFVPRQRYDLLREWVLHYVQDEAPDRVMPEAEAITRLNDLGFADVRIAYRRYMDAVLIAHKP
jgi:ubiquinone/menaquinone biosynthesis C-methylase UbiE